MRKAIRIGSLFGVELLLDTTWIVIFALVVWNLTYVFTAWHPAWTSTTVLAVSVISGLSFFASLLVHELAHVVAAKAYKLPVRNITLHMFGGAANIEREPRTPGAELVIAVVGPIASLLLGVGMVAISGTNIAAIAYASPLATLLMWLGPVNLAIGVFNLLPGFPMDGGRMLHALLWKVTGNVATATRWSTAGGQAVGLSFVALGLAMAIGVHIPVLGTGLISGLWLGMIGIFLRNAAKRHQAGAAIAHALEGVPVRALMRTRVSGVPANTSIRAVVDQWFAPSKEPSFPVHVDDRYVGMVALSDVARVPPTEWDNNTVRAIMRQPATLPPLAPGDAVMDALRKVAATGLQALPVFDDAGEFVGVLCDSDVARWVALSGSGTAAPDRPGYV